LLTSGSICLLPQRRLSSTLAAAYGEHAWQLVPQSYSLPAELQQWRAWLDEQAATGADPGPWMLKTAQHLGKGLVLLPGEAAYTAAQQPRCGCDVHMMECLWYACQSRCSLTRLERLLLLCCDVLLLTV
jgi:hypothetical protein